MTRKDYQLIASVLANFPTEGEPVDDRDAMAYDLADALGKDNPRFDRVKFLIAAGVYEGDPFAGRKVITHLTVN